MVLPAPSDGPGSTGQGRPGCGLLQWEISDEVDCDPLRVVDCPDATALEALRTELYTPPIPLDASPGFRIALARRPDGDLILLSASHPVADGVGVVRLMQTIARLYRREPDPRIPFRSRSSRLGLIPRPEDSYGKMVTGTRTAATIA